MRALGKETNWSRRIVLGALALMALGAWSAASVARAADPPPAAQKEAEDIFKSRCVTCHGALGKGDGAAAAALNPKPRDFSDAAWQKSATDENIGKAIKGGGPAVGKSPLMPGNPDLNAKPDVVAALVQYVRNLGKK